LLPLVDLIPRELTSQLTYRASVVAFRVELPKSELGEIAHVLILEADGSY
jgi:hypothetical protein